jgi:protein tyrosine/serine phosphatase
LKPSQRFARTSTAALLALSLSAMPATAGSAGDRAAASSSALSNIHIDNFGRINDNYFRGGQPKGQDYSDLAALGIKTVINLTSDDAAHDEEAMTKRSGMTYFQIPMTTHKQPTLEQIAEFLSLVTNPANQPVYVHCVGGRHRTGVMTAIYRMTQDRWSAVQAFSEMKRFKFGADILHMEFKDFVMGYRAAK